ncbi:type II toxin-antitoxin system HicB family antit oxin [Desulfonema ishimotonii]|uniref:Type II toxin-antitoxin system HicB family antit oxin n=1 Tax=Desulfonema ishimotonii TaxID=45657 RepID=A0A401G4H9_9BACT|nr:type II toxin-antitoxin system HicB family antitoxin [Desulfonema ishimotonii]GBC64035.1 type II toxin-antitoxin system HicB family antit oxin [Desulfonema ishimotonii]
MKNYISVIHKEDDSGYGVSFPDFPGCISVGNTLEEVRNMAAEALEFHIEGMLEDGEAIPEPSVLDDVVNDPENADALTFIVVPIKPFKAKAVRINITIQESTLNRIDSFAKSCGMSRSAFLALAAQKELEQQSC